MGVGPHNMEASLLEYLCVGQQSMSPQLCALDVLPCTCVNVAPPGSVSLGHTLTCRQVAKMAQMQHGRLTEV